MSSVETDLSDGIGALLTAAGVGVWNDPDAETPIVSRELNPQPDRGIAIVIGGVGDNARLSVGQRTVQLRTRGTTDTRDVDDLAHAAFLVLHGVHGIPMGDINLAHLRRTSFVSLGRDGRGRWERSDNYFADIAEPPSLNRPG